MINRRALAAIGFFAAAVVSYGVVNRITIAHLLLLALLIGFVAVRRSRWIGLALLPVISFILLYDLLRIFAERSIQIVTIGPIYDLEKAIFGIDVEGTILTPNEWIVPYLSVPLDLFGGIVYSTHVPPILIVGVAVLWRCRQRTAADYRTIATYFWGLFLVNLIAYGTMLFFPVAPPWYVEAFGSAPPEAVVVGNPARLDRVDAWLGFDYFAGVYAQGAYSFGAMPSLHCAYPVFAALHLKNVWARAAAWFWAGSMMFYAVYLNHHYIVDVIAGVGLALGVWALMRFTVVGDWTTRFYRWQLSLFDSIEEAGGADEADDAEPVEKPEVAADVG